ncbi:MAG TPA: hypothetical protein VD908_15855 [Cytophagales bacterium]|nr:hypothetical protein [Cytophagales bacterium]
MTRDFSFKVYNYTGYEGGSELGQLSFPVSGGQYGHAYFGAIVIRQSNKTAPISTQNVMLHSPCWSEQNINN